jgi:HAD superfamily hydrolase (TIGR01509 family)
MPATTLAALILDFDGLILDTETPIFEAWQDAYRRRGQSLRMEDWQQALGTYRGFDPCAQLSQLTGQALDGETLEREVQSPFLRRCEEQPLRPGVTELLVEAGKWGLGTAVASSATRTWVLGWLRKHRLADQVDEVCGREDVAAVKPAPDLFLLAARRLAVPPGACLVFEDSPNGIRAARQAGMRCVAVPNPITEQLRLPDPDLVLASVAELPLSEIARRVGLALPEPLFLPGGP